MADKKSISVTFSDPTGSDQKKNEQPTLLKSILNVLNGPKDSIERLAFESDPSLNNQYSSIYRAKTKLIPDVFLKRIAIQDDLVAAITNARANHIAAFGRPRNNRFELGFLIEPKTNVAEQLDEKQQEELQKRIKEAIEKFSTCGLTKGWGKNDKLTFSQFLAMSTRDAITVGRIATEVIWVTDVNSGQKKFHSFRPIDAATIYRAAPQKEAAESVRKDALHILEQLKNKRLVPEKFKNDEYSWVQVVDGRPVQAFTSEECLVHNFYPVTDIQLDGYPVTPLDTVIAAVTTHLNITTHNKLYFQTGRATRGMLVIRSDDVDEAVVGRIRQQFNASINSVNNAWRMPVFGVSASDEIQWQPIDSGSRDMEFQYLSDTNARVILSAYQMSPEELPGYAHLSRGTNSQSLSESNQEYLLTAHRDVGIRPLLKQFEDFINGSLFPLIDENLSKLCVLRLAGLDAETAEKESVRLQQDMPVHMTFDEVLKKVEKDPIGKELGGEFPLNQVWQSIIDKYLPVGQVMEHLLGVQGASKNPQLQYIRDPFWFQWQQLQMQMQQMQMQQQQMQMQAQQGQQGQPPSDAQQGPPQEGEQPPQGQEAGPEQSPEQPQEGSRPAEDLTRSIDQALSLLSKSEKQLPPSKRRLLAQQKKTVDHFLKGWEEDVAKATDEILRLAARTVPDPKNKKKKK